jgi:hypothetical protein
MDKQTAKAITLLTDTIVAATVAIDHATRGDPEASERAIKSAYYGLDNALTIARRQMIDAKVVPLHEDVNRCGKKGDSRTQNGR